MSNPNRLRDPDSVLDWPFDWTNWLAEGEEITVHEVVAETEGITVASVTRVGAVVTAWVSGGSAGVEYRLRCRVTTNQGRTDDRTVTLVTRQR